MFQILRLRLTGRYLDKAQIELCKPGAFGEAIYAYLQDKRTEIGFLRQISHPLKNCFRAFKRL